MTDDPRDPIAYQSDDDELEADEAEARLILSDPDAPADDKARAREVIERVEGGAVSVTSLAKERAAIELADAISGRTTVSYIDGLIAAYRAAAKADDDYEARVRDAIARQSGTPATYTARPPRSPAGR
jgi:hypothetical protein